MELLTSAALITYITELEDKSAALYGAWGEKFESQAQLYAGFAKDSAKNVKNIKRTYYSVITDALDTNFAFEGLMADVTMPEAGAGSDAKTAAEAAIAMEKAIIAFYGVAANQCRELLADVPRALDRVAKARTARIAKIQESI